MKKTIINAFQVVLVVILLSSCVSKINLIDHSGKLFVVTPEKRSKNVETASLELKQFLGKISGRKVIVVSENELNPGQKGIFLGNTLEAKKAGINSPSLAPQAWRFKTFDGNLIITGGGPADLGVLVGTYRFLDKQLGVKFYAWDCTVVPRHKYIAGPPVDITQEPSFEYRRVYDGLHHSHGLKDRKITKEKQALKKFLERNGSSSVLRPATPRFNYSKQLGRIIHNLYLYLPPEKFFKDHPEYYTMNKKGIRTSAGGHQLCLSNPEVRNIVKKTILENIAKDRSEKPWFYPTVYDFSQEDPYNFSSMCKCPECMNIINRYGGFDKYGDSSLLFHFLNPIAEEIARKYPDVYLRTFCYMSTELANPAIKPADNIIIQYCNHYSRCDVFRPLTHPNNKDQLKKLNAWTRQSENIQVWDYGNMGNSRAIDTIVDSIIANVRLYRDMKLAGVSFECEEGPYRPQSFINLHYYLYYQLLLDADQNAEELINGFMNAYYGKAAPIMKKYLRKIRKAVKNEPKALIWTTGVENRTYQTLDFMFECREMLLKAMKVVADNEKNLPRVARELNVVDACLIRYIQNSSVATDFFFLDQIINEYEKNMRIAFKGYLISPAGKDQMQKRLKDEINVLNLKIALPSQLAHVSREKIKFLIYPDFKPSIDCDRYKDPDSDMPKVMRYVSKYPKNHAFVPVFGVYDKSTKLSIRKRIDTVPMDERYHWYKIGSYSIGPKTIFWGHRSWYMRAKINRIYRPADGVENDPNLYEIWCSVKFTGPAYVEDSKKENSICIDKIALYQKQNPRKSEK